MNKTSRTDYTMYTSF